MANHFVKACYVTTPHDPHDWSDSAAGVRWDCLGLAPFPTFGRIERPQKDDAVNHPKHYTWGPVEVIEITERLGFCLGNVVKYVLRADHKGKPIEDLKKAQWYLEREIQRREREGQ